MPDTASRLQQARKAYNAFLTQIVQPMLEAAHLDEETLGFVDTALAISDPNTRRQYVDLAVSLLEANLAEYQPLAAAHDVDAPSWRKTVDDWRNVLVKLRYAAT